MLKLCCYIYIQIFQWELNFPCLFVLLFSACFLLPEPQLDMTAPPFPSFTPLHFILINSCEVKIWKLYKRKVLNFIISNVGEGRVKRKFSRIKFRIFSNFTESFWLKFFSSNKFKWNNLFWIFFSNSISSLPPFPIHFAYFIQKNALFYTFNWVLIVRSTAVFM